MVYIVQNFFPLTIPKGHIVKQRELGGGWGAVHQVIRDIKEMGSTVNEKQYLSRRQKTWVLVHTLATTM